jgi:hypothetical protein
MKKYLSLLLLVSTNLFGQTNYNTILNTKQDSIQPIDLHYQRSERYSTTASFLHLGALVSLASLYYITPGNANGFLIPAGFCATSIGFHFLSAREFKKSKNYLEDE